MKNWSDDMRLVSQDGTIDVPYDICAICLGEHGSKHIIYICSKLFDDKFCAFADYSTEAKALNAMEMLREEYQKYYSNNGGGMMATAEFYVQPFAFNHPKVFQFPKDEEIEV